MISNKKNSALGLYCRALHPAQEHFRIKNPTPQVIMHTDWVWLEFSVSDQALIDLV